MTDQELNIAAAKALGWEEEDGLFEGGDGTREGGATDEPRVELSGLAAAHQGGSV